MTRDLGAEMDALKTQMDDILQFVQRLGREQAKASATPERKEKMMLDTLEGENKEGAIFYSGQYHGEKGGCRWEPQERRVGDLLSLNGDKVAKVLAALGHKQRLDILRAVLREPLTGPELVDRLNMGTTGQLYHHLKALLGADLLVQEERGGRYALPGHRTLPLLLLLAAVSDLMDTSDYIDMTEVRNNADDYLGGTAQDGYEAHLLLWAVVENSIMEHRAGYCSEVRIFLHDDGSATVADNGRGIPVKSFPQRDIPTVQSVLTDIGRLSKETQFVAPGGEKGISIAVANALSTKLIVEIRRDGSSYRQEYKNGIPQTNLMTVGATKETGTTVTFKPDPELFGPGFDQNLLDKWTVELALIYPGLELVMDRNGSAKKFFQ